MDNRIIQSVSECYLFATLGPSVLDELVSVCSIQTHKKGQALMEQGDEVDGMRIVLDGLVRVWMNDNAGNERTLRYLCPGDVFGEIALIDGLARTSNVAAEENSQCVFLPRDEFMAILDRSPTIATHLMYLLCERLRYSIEDIGDLSFLTVRQRLCRKLFELAFDHAVVSSKGAVFARRFSQGALAKTIGASREATNRQLTALAKSGVIAIEGGLLTVKDINALKSGFLTKDAQAILPEL